MSVREQKIKHQLIKATREHQITTLKDILELKAGYDTGWCTRRKDLSDHRTGNVIKVLDKKDTVDKNRFDRRKVLLAVR